MKLNTKKTVLVGLAFLSVMAFEMMYNTIMPLILTNNMRLDETVSGMIMGADNVLALFLLPLFGTLSDRVHTRLGRRMPFILGGIALTVVLTNLLPLIANSYYFTPTTGRLAGFVAVLGLLLIVTGAYRSPAVALMPDVTPKPLRSKGNAIINLMGAIGGILFLGLSSLLYSDGNIRKWFTLEMAGDTPVVDYTVLFAAVSVIMLIAGAVMLFTVRENKMAAAAKAYEDAHPEEDLTQTDENGNTVLPKAVRKSLIFLLLSVALWYMAYNAVTTWFSKYVEEVMGKGVGGASTCLLAANAGAIISYIPIGILSSKIGRKNSIFAGVGLLTASFAAAFFLLGGATEVTVPMYALFAAVGVAWATISVNSLPMVVEMCRGSDVGKFTGFYYTFSMLAQVVTPTLSSFFLKIDYRLLFSYAAVFSALAGVTMIFVRHGDAKATAKKGLEAYEDLD